MHARAHLKLIVSEPRRYDADDDGQDRVSTVQPLSGARMRRQWLRNHAAVVALWSASVLLLSLAGLIALGWL